VCILVVCWAADAAAQSVFVQGGAGPDIRRFSAEEGQAVFDGSASMVTFGGGAFVTPRMTIGVELDFAGMMTETRSVTVPIGGVPTTVTSSFALERRSVTALAGVHTSGAHRVRLGGYAGVGFSTVRREIATDVVGLPGPPPGPSILIDRLAGPVVGVDVAVTIVRYVALVGALRAQGLALTGEVTGFSLRPAGLLRVTF
jgi:hypothetical protein